MHFLCQLSCRTYKIDQREEKAPHPQTRPDVPSHTKKCTPRRRARSSNTDFQGRPKRCLHKNINIKTQRKIMQTCAYNELGDGEGKPIYQGAVLYRKGMIKTNLSAACTGRTPVSPAGALPPFSPFWTMGRSGARLERTWYE